MAAGDGAAKVTQGQFQARGGAAVPSGAARRRAAKGILGKTGTTASTRSAGDFRLRILATSDLHAHLMPYDYAWDQPLDNVGLTRTASLIRAARQEVTDSILIDNGDFLQGSPLGELYAADHMRSDGPHPVIAAMNEIGYDAAALGNHEFSFGLPFLQAALSAARFPVICANAVRTLGADPGGDSPFVPPVKILDRTLTSPSGERASIRIGLVGLLPPQVAQWEVKHLSGRIVVRDAVEAARAWAGRLRAMGADLVIALCHSGIGPSEAIEGMENAAVPIARLDGIDALVAGHIHLPFPGPDLPLSPDIDPAAGRLCGKPAVMAGAWGSHLGLIDLDLRLRGGRWRIAGHRSEARPIARRQPDGRLLPLCPSDPRIEAVVQTAHRITLAHVREPIGRTDAPMHSYFARLADSAALQLIHAAQLDWLTQVAAETGNRHLPLLSAASPFKSGGRGGPDYFTDIPAGDLAHRHVSDLYVFPNAVRALLIDGATLAEWLERAAAQFLQLAPGRSDQPLFDPDAPSYNFDTIAGVGYEIDLRAPARYDLHGHLARPEARRIGGLVHQGRPVEPDAQFLIATNNFRAAGGGGFPGIGTAAVVAQPLALNSEVIRAYICRHRSLAPRPAHNWRLAPMPAGTGAWFDTGPRARAHLGEAIGLTVEPLGETRTGFLRCRLLF